MAFARKYPTTAVLLALVAVAVSEQHWKEGSIREELPPSPCVPLKCLSVKSVFAEYPSPHVGYAIDPIEARHNPAKQLREYIYRDQQFRSLKLDLIVADHQCFSNLPNMASFATFSYFYTPCINPTVRLVPINNGEETVNVTTDFFLVPPCRSLCEAALEELARFELPGESLEEACPNVRNLTTPIVTLLERYSDVFNCSNYPIGDICVPRRSPAISCDPIPSDHAARRLIPGHFQTGYPTHIDAAAGEISQTHLRSFDEANREFESLGIDKMIVNATCQMNLPSTVLFLAYAYFPACTAYPGKNISLTFPCRGFCMEAREELSRYNSRDELIRDCPAIPYIPASSLHTDLGLPRHFECSKYKDNLCKQNPNGDPPINCPKSTTVCDACRTSFRSVVNRKITFGKVERKYDYACVMSFMGNFSGLCSWSLSMEVRHCYFYNSVNIALPEGYNVNITVELHNRSTGCSPCDDIPPIFGYPSLAHLNYLVAGQHVTTYTGTLGWGLDHTHRNSLVVEYTGSKVQTKKIEKSLNRIGIDYLAWTSMH